MPDSQSIRLLKIAWASGVAKRPSEPFWALSTKGLVHLKFLLPASLVPSLAPLGTREAITHLALRHSSTHFSIPDGDVYLRNPLIVSSRALFKFDGHE